MAYKYRNVRITGGVIYFPANDVVISGPGIAAGYESLESDDSSYTDGSFRNNTTITLLCLLTHAFEDDYPVRWTNGWNISLWNNGGYPKEGSVSLSPGASFRYRLLGDSSGAMYRLMFGHTDHPLVNIAGGVWNGYLYEVV